MTSGTRFEQGDVLIVPFPFTDLTMTKQRPVVVLSRNQYNATREDIITCGVTSNLQDRAFSVIITSENLSKGRIPKTSMIKVDKLFTMEKGIVRKKIAKVDSATLETMKREFYNLV